METPLQEFSAFRVVGQQIGTNPVHRPTSAVNFRIARHTSNESGAGVAISEGSQETLSRSNN